MVKDSSIKNVVLSAICRLYFILRDENRYVGLQVGLRLGLAALRTVLVRLFMCDRK
jgi:hypothetical protein